MPLLPKLCASYQYSAKSILLLWLVAVLMSACNPNLQPPAQLIVQNSNKDLYLLAHQQQAGSSSKTSQLWAMSKDGRARRVSNSATESYLQAAVVRGIGWDADRQLIIVSDAAARALLAIDPDTGAMTVLSDATRGDGPQFGYLGALVVDVTGERAVVIDQQVDTQGVQRILTSVDLNTGDRKILAGRFTGQGPLEYAQAITYDAHQQQFYVAYQSGLLLVDGVTGDRSRFSDGKDGIGPGTAWLQADTIDYDYAGHRLLVTDAQQQKVIAVALATGDRAEIASWTPQSAPGAVWGQSAAFDQGTLWLANQEGLGVLGIKVAESNHVTPWSIHNEVACLSFYMDFTKERMVKKYQPAILPLIYPIAYPIELMSSLARLELGKHSDITVCDYAVTDEFLVVVYFLPIAALTLVPELIF